MNPEADSEEVLNQPVEASWKSGRARWMEGFLTNGVTSDFSATAKLLLSSVSLQHNKMWML